MAVSGEQLARELRAFDGRRQLVQAMRRGLTRAVRPVRDSIREHALAILPSSGGLGRWVAAARITVKISYASRSAGIRMVGTRRSARQRTDLNRIDAGRVRAPSWGRRTRGSWHTQAVTPGWFTTPVSDDEAFIGQVDAEVDNALGVIRG